MELVGGDDTMKVPCPYKCDYCLNQKGETNHWWLRPQDSQVNKDTSTSVQNRARPRRYQSGWRADSLIKATQPLCYDRRFFLALDVHCH
jgi:hypothetical protein